MEVLPRDPILEYNVDTLEAVRNEIGLTKLDTINEAINILEGWIMKQNHFTKKDFSRDYLERSIVISKGSVERAKRKIEKLCTLKTLMPQFYTDVDTEDFFIYKDIVNQAHLPKLTKHHIRIYLLRLQRDDFDSSLFHNFYKTNILFAEYLSKNDYCSGFEIIIDCRDINILSFVAKNNPMEFKQIMVLFMEGYGMRIKGIHIITESKMVDALVGLLKQVVSAKVAGRIHVHKTLDTLYKQISKDILPVEYGGKEISLKELNDKWSKVLNTKEFKDYFKVMSEAKTNERCRQSIKFNEEYAGTAGSFRALVVD